MKKHKWTAPQLIALVTTIGLILLLVGSMTQQLLVSGDGLVNGNGSSHVCSNGILSEL